MDQNAQPLFAKPAADKPAGSKNNKGLIIGICCGAGALVILIVVLILVLVLNGGKTLSCEKSDELSEGTQKGGITVKFDGDDKVSAVSMWEEDIANQEFSDSEFDELKKAYENFDKEKYSKFDVIKIDNRTIRLEIDLKLNDEQKNEYETPEKAKKAIEALGFTCKE